MTGKHLQALLVAAALSLGGSARGEEKATFLHEFHVNQADLKCLDCHQTRPAGTPTVNREKCKECHGDDGPPAFELQRFKRLENKGFPHPTHDAALDCKTCHAAILEADYGGKPMVDLKTCRDCHSENGYRTAERQCVVCHGLDKKLQKPKDHVASNWKRIHGEQALDREADQHGRDCKLCHGTDACTRCHRDNRPANHTGLWRVRLHGSAASWDRETCKTCHETGSCVRCHQNTRPLNHNASWRTMHGLAAQTTDNATCLACHRASQCIECHRKPGGNGP